MNHQSLSMISRKFLLVALIDVSFTSPAIASSLIVNGSFEAPVITTNGFRELFGTDTSVTGWTAVVVAAPAGLVLANGSYVHGFGPYSAADGAQFIDFNVGGGKVGSYIYQDFSTTVGQVYTATFNIGRMSGYGDTIRLLLQIQNPGTGLPDFSQSFTPSAAVGWSDLQTYSWVATGSSTRLAFIDDSVSPINSDLGLDNITVVPEPTTWAMLAGGFVSLLAFRRRW